jgi:hypothetical protein
MKKEIHIGLDDLNEEAHKIHCILRSEGDIISLATPKANL